MTSCLGCLMVSVGSSDRVRQVTVTGSEIFALVGTLYGVGVLGTRVEESSWGALAADATRLAPAGPAFSIWSVIYLGLAAYTIWQWLPGQNARAVHRRIGYLAAASMVLNASWLLVTQQGWIWVSVGVTAALALVLGVLLSVSCRTPRALASRSDHHRRHLRSIPWLGCRGHLRQRHRRHGLQRHRARCFRERPRRSGRAARGCRFG